MASDFPTKPLLGKSKEELYHQRNAEYSKANRIIESPDIRPQHTTKGTALYLKNKPRPGQGGGNTVIAVRIAQSPSANTIVCEKDGDFYTVAIPRLLRGHTNQTRTKTGTVGSTSVTEEQRITPMYEVGEVLLIENVGEDVTGLEGVDWTDRNEAARAWAAVAATLNP